MIVGVVRCIHSQVKGFGSGLMRRACAVLRCDGGRAHIALLRGPEGPLFHKSAVHGSFASLRMTRSGDTRDPRFASENRCGVGTVNKQECEQRIPCHSRHGANGNGVLRFAQDDKVELWWVRVGL